MDRRTAALLLIVQALQFLGDDQDEPYKPQNGQDRLTYRRVINRFPLSGGKIQVDRRKIK